MTWIVLSLLAQDPTPPLPQSWVYSGRLYDTPTLHVGVRPAAFVDAGSFGVGVTVQISAL